MIYLDHAATTPLHEDVLQAMYAFERNIYGNPSSTHTLGRNAKMYLESARETVAEAIAASEKEIIFTSGGTEANNLAIIGTALANQHKGKHIITTAQEHQAVLEAMDYLTTIGFTVTYLPVDARGEIQVSALKQAITAETILVSIMTVNNETGVIQPIEACGDVLREHDIYFHTDAVQALGVIDLDVEALGVDLLTASAHKINGPKGIGMLYVRTGVVVQQTHFGGNQEKVIRPGTENIVGAIGFQKALELVEGDKAARVETYAAYVEKFLGILKSYEIAFQLNGRQAKQVNSILNVRFEGVAVEVLLTNLDLAGIAASAGSACTAGTMQASHVLTAMYGEDSPIVNESIRFSFGLANTEENVVKAAEQIATIVSRLQK